MNHDFLNALGEADSQLSFDKFEALYTCPLCHEEQVDIVFNRAKNGDYCFAGAVLDSLEKAGWDDQDGLCPSCAQKHYEGEQEHHEYMCGKEAI